MRPHRRELAFAVERGVPRERLEQHTAERVDVGGRATLFPLDPLRRGIGERPHERAGAREPRLLVRCASDPEVGEVDVLPVGVAAVRDQDVRRFDVAMNESVRVGGAERPRDGRQQARRVGRCQDTFARKQVP